MTKKFEYITVMGFMTNRTLDTEDFDNSVSKALNDGWEISGSQSVTVTETSRGDSLFIQLQPMVKITEE